MLWLKLRAVFSSQTNTRQIKNNRVVRSNWFASALEAKANLPYLTLIDAKEERVNQSGCSTFQPHLPCNYVLEDVKRRGQKKLG